MSKNAADVKKELDKFLGDDERFLDIVYGLKKLIGEAKATADKQDRLAKIIKEASESSGTKLSKLIKLIDGLKVEIPDFEVKFPRQLKTIIANPPKYPKEIKIKNFPKYPKEVRVKKPKWYKRLDLKPLATVIEGLVKKTFNVYVTNQDPKDPISVRLSNGRWFYNAIAEVIAGGSSGEVKLLNAAASIINPATEDKQDDIITKLTTPTGIEGSPVTVGTTAVELTFTGTTRVISIKADSGNTGKIWFGPASVDNSGNNAYGELTADSAVEIELNDVSAALYVVSDTASQKVYKAALT